MHGKPKISIFEGISLNNSIGGLIQIVFWLVFGKIPPAVVAGARAARATSAFATSKDAGDAEQEKQEQPEPAIGHNLLLQSTLLLPFFSSN